MKKKRKTHINIATEHKSVSPEQILAIKTAHSDKRLVYVFKNCRKKKNKVIVTRKSMRLTERRQQTQTLALLF